MHGENILASFFNAPIGFLCGAFVGLISKIGFAAGATTGWSVVGGMTLAFAAWMLGWRLIDWIFDFGRDETIREIARTAEPEALQKLDALPKASADSKGQRLRVITLWGGYALGLAAALFLPLSVLQTVFGS